MDDQQEPSTRERILAAAAAILREGGATARLSVRTVAARAGVSVGSLRHHFPTQQDLRDEVMRRALDRMMPRSSIGDRSVPPRDRLVQCLLDVLDLSGTGAQAREGMATMASTFITAEQTASVREAYLAAQRDGQRRTEDWLRTLAEECAIPAEDIPRRARFLSTVLDGLSLERSLPAVDARPQVESEVLFAAADVALAPADRDG